ncbi:hypothetical protein B0J12DRAFT_418674 [Macrophomina phaseolina]|uniref:Uncharacterized protein n=1 Tax=Macrophomina phaseolina TaxID=35725 RepID=A0ABQ8FTZ0_9PEZI|nr:hypothetical protein B0J12DRAFT_418674 [Macrophomina phaseolina]
MRFSTNLFLAVAAARLGLAMPAAAADVSVVDGVEYIVEKLNIDDVLGADYTIDEVGYIEKLVDIPELANLSLIEVDGDLVFDIPATGLDLSDESWEKISGEKPKKLTARDIELMTPEKRACWQNPCDCGTYRTYALENINWSKAYGGVRAMSQPLCGPGAIAKTYTYSWSYTITGSISPGWKPSPESLLSLGISVGFSYTFGDAVATGYTATCEGRHPCIATFKPWVGTITGRGLWRDLSKEGNKLCRSGRGGNIELKVPIVASGCKSSKDSCGADGAWGHCYFLGDFAKRTCGNTLGATPWSEACPSNLYPA